MKCNVTKSAVRENYLDIIAIGYCDAYNLLSRIEPFAYSTGVYGWNCDYYHVGNVCISTGYRPIGKRVDYAMLQEYESMARTIRETNHIYEETKEKIMNLLYEFVQKAIV